MIVRSIRRLTEDCFHSAFTGTEWFQGALYVGYRHGDAHVCDQGRLVVQRSRDGGVHFDIATVVRGDSDTRDAHLYSNQMGWREMGTSPDDKSEYTPPNAFVDVHERIAGRAGVVYFAADFEAGAAESGRLHIGHDGAIRVWVNGEHVFQGPGRNPAKVDEHTVPIRPRPGRNRVVIALDTNAGKAWGIMARFEASR